MKESNYEIFISFKNLDEKGKQTRDSALAKIVYDQVELLSSSIR